MEWSEDNEHIFLLQEKINAYLTAIETGKSNEKYLASVGKKIISIIRAAFTPTPVPSRKVSTNPLPLIANGQGARFSADGKTFYGFIE